MSNNFLIRPPDQMIDGTYVLGPVVQRSAAGAVYETRVGNDARPAVIKIRYAEEAPGVERLVEQWRTAGKLTHPHLLRIYTAGFSKLDHAPIVYLVMERADASLAGVLTERALSEAELRELLSPMLSALGYLHRNGFAHGGLKPSNILAAGDWVKLSTDNALMVEDGADPAEDMRALGTLIVQALTPELPTGVRALPDASEGLKDIVRHCLEPDPKKRWMVDQVEARLHGPVAAAVPVVELPVVKERSQDSEEASEEASPSPGVPRWILAALPALVLIVVLAAYWRKMTPVATAVTLVPVVQHAAPSASWPAGEVQGPEPAKPSPTGRVKPPASANKGRRGDGWSVVVATYGSREAAEKRQGELARKWPKFNFIVFPQPTERAQFPIVIGKNLSEDEADSLRKRAVASGIPSDTYIKKFQ